jgi:hypothetical protein
MGDSYVELTTVEKPWPDAGETYAIDPVTGRPYNWIQRHIGDIGDSDEDQWETLGLKNRGIPNARAFYKAHANAKAGVMVAKYSFNKQWDMVKAMRWTDMFMDTWMWAAGMEGVDPAKLKYIIRDNIFSARPTDDAHQTRRVIDAAYEQVGADPSVPREFRADASSPAERAAFQALAGTVHVSRPIMMLADFTKTMKNVEVESLKPLIAETLAEKNPSPTYHLVIKLRQTED